MGSCCEWDNRKTKRIDDTAGGLVWVRRRNGSWWPGRILGPEELPESYSVSHRAGTPVKLLGREDASMDWYDLEKSKRIKAFRCGEYDECIEKARASAVQASREAKERKYARREDAILHALELEKAHNMQSKQDLGSMVNRRNGTVRYSGLDKEQSHLVRKGNKPEGKCQTKLSQYKVPLEEKVKLNTVEVRVMQEEGWKTSTDSEDDGTEGAKRMRGLQELGLGVVSKKKCDMIQTEGPSEPSLHDNTSLDASNIDNGLSSMSTVNSSKEPCSPLKKRTQITQVHESLKRKNRRRQLTKVLKSSASVEAPSICCGVANSNQFSLYGVTWNRVGVPEHAGSKKTEYPELATGSLGSSETSCVEASLDAYEDPCDPAFDGANFCSLASVDDGFLDIPVVWKEIRTGGNHCYDVCSEFASSASRKLQSNAVERQDKRYCKVDPIRQDLNIDLKGSSSFPPHVNNSRQRIDKSTSNKDAEVGKNSKYGYTSSGSRKLFSKFDPSKSYLMGKPDLGAKVRINNSSFGESLTSDNGDPRAKCELISDGMQDWSMAGAPKINCLADVDCEGQVYRSAEQFVQSDERGDICYSPTAFERPTESFFTRDLLLSRLPPRRSLPRRQTHATACSCCHVRDQSIRRSTVGSTLYDVKLEVQARYQGPRVPLISLMSKLNGKAIVGHPIIVEVLEDGSSPAATSNIGMCCDQKENQSKHKRDMVNDSIFQDGDAMVVKLQRRTGYITKLHPDTQRRPSHQLIVRSCLSGKKSSKIRKSGFLARKVRKLSAITVDCEHEEEKRKPVVQIPGQPVACVPLKLVFSRLNEALNCPSQPGKHADWCKLSVTTLPKK